MKELRTVLDTNVVLASQRTTSATSPNAAILAHWKDRHFIWLVSTEILIEYAAKLAELNIAEHRIEALLVELGAMAECVPTSFYHVRRYPADADDTPFLLTALNGEATHLVTYDGHLEAVGIFYQEFKTCRPIEFLADLRALA
jgi:uncharacterized protein